LKYLKEREVFAEIATKQIGCGVMIIGGGRICAMAPLAEKSRIVVSTITGACFVVMLESGTFTA